MAASRVSIPLTPYFLPFSAGRPRQHPSVTFLVSKSVSSGTGAPSPPWGMRCCPSPTPSHPTNKKHLQLSSTSPAIGFSWAISTLRKLRARPAAQSLARSSSVEVEGLGLRLDQHSGGSSAVEERDASCTSSGTTAGMEATGELVRKPLVQWAAQLEIYGASRFTPHHVGAQPGKSILKERWASGMDLGPDLGGQLSVPKSAVITHPKPATTVTGVKRSRMAAFR